MATDRRRTFLRWTWLVPVAVLVAVAALRPTPGPPEGPAARPDAEAESAGDMTIEASAHRSAPTIGGVRLPTDVGGGPPTPSRAPYEEQAIPFAQWWSGLATEDHDVALWANPLLLRIGPDGRGDLGVPTATVEDDGTRGASATPAMFLEFGPDSTLEVVDHGDLHVRFAVHTDTAAVLIALVQGSPFVELEGVGQLVVTVPGLGPLEDPSNSDGVAVRRLDTAEGPWLLGSSGGTGVRVDGDRVTLDLSDGNRYVLGPSPSPSPSNATSTTLSADRFDAALRAVVAAPLLDTVETVAVDADGTVHQRLDHVRDGDGDGPTAWVLLPHHQRFLSASAHDAAGTLAAGHGTAPVLVGGSLELEYPSVPILWEPVLPEGFDASAISPAGGNATVATEPAVGSYFGGKEAATAALELDLLRLASLPEAAASARSTAVARLSALVSGGGDPRLTWNDEWGSVIVTPAEFGAGTHLNDHHLQYGYWVGAAASVLADDPSQRLLVGDAIELLIADYGGAAVVPEFTGLVSDEGAWSAFEGHGWASGTGGFGAGNSLESISESTYAWWAAAKWFLATDRPDLAEPFIARLTIESWLTGTEWLPTSTSGATDSNRPWSGVVWAGKTDNGTWFSAADEAALGIRLLPLGPQSFSRYPDDASTEAARRRWTWCEQSGDGCGSMWSNLLDSDAVVAGRSTLPPGPAPEASTSELIRIWWRAHWESTEPASDWSCSPGTVVRRMQSSEGDGALVALVTNPGTTDAEIICHSATRSETWIALAGTAELRPLDTP